jgi:adenosylhomocysteine nucleosidase
LAAEARIARRLGYAVEIGGGTAQGAAAAAERLAASGVSALVSFGLAGGLNPTLRPGTIIIPSAVWLNGAIATTDPELSDTLGQTTPHRLLAETQIAATAVEKAALRRATGSDAIDLETAGLVRVAIARGLSFAVLRAVCDPAWRDLPPAAVAALSPGGRIAFLRLLRAVAPRPAQIATLLALAGDAIAAQRALLHHVTAIRTDRPDAHDAIHSGCCVCADTSANPNHRFLDQPIRGPRTSKASDEISSHHGRQE